jgi:hypothetical protein
LLHGGVFSTIAGAGNAAWVAILGEPTGKSNLASLFPFTLLGALPFTHDNRRASKS